MTDATSIADQIRNLYLNQHVEFMFLGDPLKTLVLSTWGKSTDLPGVYNTSYNSSSEIGVIHCNIWDLPNNFDPAYRMFPLDGTEDTGFDYCIVVYDVTSPKSTSDNNLEKWLSVKDLICSRQHPNRLCVVIVLIIKTPRTKEETYEHIKIQCSRQGISVILVDHTAKGIEGIRALPEDLANRVIEQRKEALLSKIEAIVGI